MYYVGGYKSEPACATVTIAWEVAFQGTVLGADNTGNIPVQDVTVTWSLASNPSISNSVITNKNGQYYFNIKVSSTYCINLTPN